LVIFLCGVDQFRLDPGASLKKITVKVVRTPAESNDFFSLKRKIYRDDPSIVFPLKKMERQQLDPDEHPFYQHARRELFVAYQDGIVVGRIAAIVDEMHNEHYGERTGFFGFFEAVDDQQVVSELIRAAAEFLKLQGCDRMRGPVNPSMKSDFGVVVEGNDISPMIMMGYSLKRYDEQLQAEGLGVIRTFHSYRFLSKDGEKSHDKWEAIRKVEQRSLERYPQLNIKVVTHETFDQTIREINELGNTVRSEGWGFVPLTEAELGFMIKNLRRVINYDMIHVAYWEDQLIGYIVTIPDVNWALKRAKGKWDWLRMLQMPRLLKKTKSARVIAIGVDEKFRFKGAAMMLIRRLSLVHHVYDEWEFSWVDSENVKSIRAIGRMLPLVKTKVYRLYEKMI
jgi:hypothetical protein